ncbi:hypothetical protein HJG60_009941 [Phyllostomus discolor]|uniref:Uncharacterized protein n=1 Tax=Phyllostomus discolor TaxID=89673 RepID=A0A834EQI5_9CHIR|nr:hypothetical protein HJG60_009941 [Phyllostomus discolor]
MSHCEGRGQTAVGNPANRSRLAAAQEQRRLSTPKPVDSTRRCLPGAPARGGWGAGGVCEWWGVSLHFFVQTMMDRGPDYAGLRAEEREAALLANRWWIPSSARSPVGTQTGWPCTSPLAVTGVAQGNTGG